MLPGLDIEYCAELFSFLIGASGGRSMFEIWSYKLLYLFSINKMKNVSKPRTVSDFNRFAPLGLEQAANLF